MLWTGCLPQAGLSRQPQDNGLRELTPGNPGILVVGGLLLG